MKKYLLIPLLLALISCQDPISPTFVSQTNNPKVQVDLLFKHDGCTVYRFIDNYIPVYYADCQNHYSTTSWEQSCGEDCKRPKSVTTSQEQP